MSKLLSVIIALKIVPKAHKNEIVGWENNELKIRISAVPEKGDANEELIRFLAKTLKISQSQIVIIQGHKSRHKRISISSLSAEKVELAFLPPKK